MWTAYTWTAANTAAVAISSLELTPKPSTFSLDRLPALERLHAPCMLGAMMLIRSRAFLGPGGRVAKWEMLEEHKRLEVTLPPSAGGRQLIQVWAGPQVYQMRCSPRHVANFVEYTAPSIIFCTSVGLLGDIMSITGRNFGNAGDIAVRIAGTLCRQPVLKELHNRISCQVPEALGNKVARLSVKVCVGGRWSDPGNPAAVFSYRD
jgi:hypothetical protein